MKAETGSLLGAPDVLGRQCGHVEGGRGRERSVSRACPARHEDAAGRAGRRQANSRKANPLQRGVFDGPGEYGQAGAPGSRTIWLHANGTKYGFQEKYLRRIADLPEARLFVGPDNTKEARFDFTGGSGVLMPCRY
ncbi:hypothetical protein ACB245_27845 [Achromobacter ruhlandii]|uniref:hypothetical protein n=1 Tax=Achromobacter ruhlandii TaxID=72557 RepID=UPI0035587C39